MPRLRLAPYLIASLLAASAGLAPRVGAASAAASPRAPGTPPPNVILILIDTLRAGHLSSYGYVEPTTPNLDARVAAPGVRFADVTSPASWTCPASGALLTGRDPTRLGISWYSWTNAMRPEETSLAEYFRAQGYATAGFVANAFVSSRVGFDQGFDHFDDSLMYVPRSQPVAGPMTDLVITWTQQFSGTQPLFLFVHYMDPHTWYNPPPPWDIRYDPTYTGTITPAVFGDGYDVIVGNITLTPRDIQHVNALYDGEISYTDEQIGRLLDYLDSRGLLGDALVVVTADHGEMFGEHGRWTHGNGLWEETLRVPLMMRYSGVITAGLVVTAPVQSMDLMPTILDYAGIALTGTLPLQAISLRPLIEGTPPAPRPVYAEIDGLNDPAHWGYLNAPRVDMRSMREGLWKYTFYVTNPSSDTLYYLEPSPPYESVNLIQNEPERAARMQQAIKNWFGINRAHLPAFMFMPP